MVGKKIPRRRKGSGKLRKKAPKPAFDGPLPLGDPEGRCIALRKNCPKCGYRYLKGDRSPKCPHCEFERRCKNKAIKGAATCRSHGGTSPSAQAGTAKFRVAHQIFAAYQRARATPDLLTLSHEIAVNAARTDELMGWLDTYDTHGASGQITNALGHFESLLQRGLHDRMGKDTLEIDPEEFKAAVTALRRAIEPVNLEEHIWDKLEQSIEFGRRLNDTERKWLVSNEGMVPVVFVLEVLILIQRITLKYIRNQDDRSAYAKEWRNAVPIEAVARAVG